MILIIRYLHVFEWLGDYLETSLLILCFLWYTRKLKREEDDYFRGEIYLQWESKIMYLSRISLRFLLNQQIFASLWAY